MKTQRKALMVYPEFPENSYWNMKQMHSLLLPKNKYGYTRGNQPSLGLLCIAPVLEEYYERSNMKMIDMNIQPLTDEDLAWADDLYLSYMLTQSESANEVAKKAKEAGKVVIAGGPGVSVDDAYSDYRFINEAELSLRPFLDEFLTGGRPTEIQRGELPTPSQFFRPDYSWIDPWHYASIPVQFSRGCPHDCEFCDITIRYGRKMRVSKHKEFFEDLQNLYERSWRRQVFIIDDNFIGKPSESLALLRELKVWQQERDYPFEFYTQASVLLAEKNNDELLSAFAPAGFSMIFLGIETPNLESLKETNKNHNLKDGLTLAQKVRRIQEVGRMLVLGGFIVGFDSDGLDIFERQKQFIKEIGIPTPMVGLLQPLPSTRLEERLVKEKRLLSRGKGNVASGLDVIFTPKLMNSEQLHNGYVQLLKDLYTSMPEFYERCLDSIRFVANPPFGVIYKYDEVIAIINIIYQEGIKSSYRKYFWKYMATLLLHHRKKIAYGIRWAAFGLHYNRLTNRIINNSSSMQASNLAEEITL